MISASPPAPQRTVPVPSQLVGRDAELETLQAALLRARRSPLQLIWISGESGMGKSALAAQLRQRTWSAGGHFALGKCEQFSGATLLQAPRQALSQLLAVLAAKPTPARTALATVVREALGSDGAALLTVLPNLARLLGPLPEPAPLEPQEHPQRLLSLLVELHRVLADQCRPLVLVFDDLHWADPLSLALIDALLKGPDLHGVLLLGLFRSTEVAEDSGLARLLERAADQPHPPFQLTLANLSVDQVAQLMATRLPADLGALEALSEPIQRCTGGNPFFVHQLLNALEREGLLHPTACGEGAAGLQGQLRQRLACTDVVTLLSGDLERLPPAGLVLLQCLACLGSQANLALLAEASGQALDSLPAQLRPALDLGVLVCSRPDQLSQAAPDTIVAFGHDRLQQAVVGLAPQQPLHLAMARRLLAAGRHQLAADHFAACTGMLTIAKERRRVADLLHEVGTAALEQADFSAAERLLQQAMVLLGPEAWRRYPSVTIALQRQLHQLAYCRADYACADALYAELERWARCPEQLLEPAAIQVMALSNRCHYQAAVDLVAGLLGQLAIPIPLEQPQPALERDLDAFMAMVERGGLHRLPPLPSQPPTGGSAAKLLNRLVPAAFFCNPPLACWLVLHSTQQWLAGDAHPARLYPLACTLLATVPARHDYATGYRAARTALALGEASPHGLETARTRHVFSLFCQHWFEPLEAALAQARRAHRDQQRSGELEFACYTFYTTQAAVLECGPQLDELAEENRRALDFARRSGNRHAEPAFIAYSELINTLRDPAAEAAPGLTSAELCQLGQVNPMAACYHHLYRALSAALLGEGPALQRHAQAASALEPYITGFYPVALIKLLSGLALVGRLDQDTDGAAAAELSRLLAWWAARSAESPQNFGHLAQLLQAERLAAAGRGVDALPLYEQALRAAVAHQRPWHAALACERSARCYLALGLEQAGQALLLKAQKLYGNWGANRKVAALEQDFPFLRAASDSSQALADLLQASQALGQLRTVPELAQATATLIARLSGATDVQIVVLDADGRWQLRGGIAVDGPLSPQSLEGAERSALLPTAAMRLCLQLLQPLIASDATLDPRFASDPHLEGLACCALLVVPVLVQGRPIAVVIAEHRQQRGVFGADLVRSVELLCGQLAVALENLLIQRSLEQQVRERSQDLERAYAREAGNEERRRRQLEQKLKTSLTAAAVVHEIQQPLAAILLNCHLSADNLAALPAGAATKDLEQRLAALSSDAQQVVATMERMRMLLRNVETSHSPIDLTANLLSAVVFLRPDLETQHVQLMGEGLDQPCLLQGDGAQLQMAVVNLVRNAIQALVSQPREARRLQLQLQRHPDHLNVVVADSGPGFPPHYSNDTSWELLKSTKATGMGLGLFLAETAATNHRGRLRIGRSLALGGAEVVLELPLLPQGPSPSQP